MVMVVTIVCTPMQRFVCRARVFRMFGCVVGVCDRVVVPATGGQAENNESFARTGHDGRLACVGSASTGFNAAHLSRSTASSVVALIRFYPGCMFALYSSLE